MNTCVEPNSYRFDRKYVARLRACDPEIGRHFAAYFSRELDRWLWPRLHSAPAVEDVRQETLRRVLDAVQHRNVWHESHGLAAFVNGVCKKVLLEYWRKAARFSASDKVPEERDAGFDPEQTVSLAEKARRVRDALLTLSPQSRQLIKMLYLEERDREEISESIGVDRRYMRVLTYRAIHRLRDVLLSANSAHAPGSIKGTLPAS